MDSGGPKKYKYWGDSTGNSFDGEQPSWTDHQEAAAAEQPEPGQQRSTDSSLRYRTSSSSLQVAPVAQLFIDRLVLMDSCSGIDWSVLSEVSFVFASGTCGHKLFIDRLALVESLSGIVRMTPVSLSLTWYEIEFAAGS